MAGYRTRYSRADLAESWCNSCTKKNCSFKHPVVTFCSHYILRVDNSESPKQLTLFQNLVHN